MLKDKINTISALVNGGDLENSLSAVLAKLQVQVMTHNLRFEREAHERKDYITLNTSWLYGIVGAIAMVVSAGISALVSLLWQ